MNDVELMALGALVNQETTVFEASFRQYGEMRWDPNTPAVIALNAELARRGVIKPLEPAAGGRLVRLEGGSLMGWSVGYDSNWKRDIGGPGW